MQQTRSALANGAALAADLGVLQTRWAFCGDETTPPVAVDLGEYGLRLVMLGIGLGALSITVVIARTAERRGGALADQVRLFGLLGSLGSWWLFWGPPSHHGQLNTPDLLLMAAATPLLGCERGRWMAARTAHWIALLTFTLASACSVVLPLTSQTIELQVDLLVGGTLLPVPLVVIVALGQWLHWRLS